MRGKARLIIDRHAYVRKNAVFAIASIYQHLEQLIPDAPELLMNFLEEENGTLLLVYNIATLIYVANEHDFRSHL